jgi:hypothetical protein
MLAVENRPVTNPLLYGYARLNFKNYFTNKEQLSIFCCSTTFADNDNFCN